MKAVLQICGGICGGDTAGNVVKINVGGTVFTTARHTFDSCPPDSVLPKLLKQKHAAYDGAYFLDRDGRHFRHILNFCRDGPEKFTVLDSLDDKSRTELRREAEFLGLTSLVNKIDEVSQTLRWESAASEPSEVLSEVPPLADVVLGNSEESFDNIATTVAVLLDVPVVMINLIEDEEQWCKARFGIPLEAGDCRANRSESFCGMIPETDMWSTTMLVVEDARTNPRTSSNPFVVGEPHVWFYAGLPLISAKGSRIGSMCALDSTKPAKLHRDDGQFMINMGNLILRELEREQLDQDVAEMVPWETECSEGAPTDGSEYLMGPARMQRMQEALDEVIALVNVNLDNMDWPILYTNPMWTVWTDTTVIPPSKGDEHAKVKGNGLIHLQDSPAVLNQRGPLLKDWVNLVGKTESTLLDELKNHQSYGRADTMFSMEASVRTSFARLPVHCRFVSYSAPIDVTAAGIHIPPSSVPQSELTSKIGAHGLLYFVVMKQQFDSTPWSRHQSLQETALTSAMSTSDRESHLGSKVAPSSGDSGGFTRSHSLQSPFGIKPPTSPFQDVKLVRMIGKGSFGKVFYGMWMGAAVAVKVLDTRGASCKSRDEPRFEANISANISHPHLVQTFKFSTRPKVTVFGSVEEEENDEDGSQRETWIVQEWCDLGTLGSKCKQPRLGQESMWEVLDITREVCSAGAYLHSRGIIHGDLTANNVLLRSAVSPKGYVCKLADFGLARVLEGEESEIMTTQLGTVTHMPPELFKLNTSEARLTPKADVYASGVLLWQSLTGKVPYGGLSPPQVVMQVASGRSLKLPAEVPDGVQAVYQAMTATDANQRMDFDEVVDELYALMEVYLPLAILEKA
mmetsp:Transcript_42886/g.98383  ORF Transcript_42886/g.98383 Transcript_42886/m.98383 type:complete len:855 (-) Transcript_42886:3-2567(-)